MHDLNADGKGEVVAGTGMNTYAVNGQGQQLWAFRDSKSHCPSMRAIVFADMDGDGVDEPIGGASDMWYLGALWAIGPKGEEKATFSCDGWCSGIKTAITEDLAGEGKTSLIAGTRQGGVACYPDLTNASQQWYRRFGDSHRAPRHAAGETKGASSSSPRAATRTGSSLSIGGGAKVWSIYFDAAVAAMSSSAAKDRLYVACDDGSVHELDSAGRLLRSATLDGRPNVAVAFPSRRGRVSPTASSWARTREPCARSGNKTGDHNMSMDPVHLFFLPIQPFVGHPERVAVVAVFFFMAYVAVLRLARKARRLRSVAAAGARPVVDLAHSVGSLLQGREVQYPS